MSERDLHDLLLERLTDEPLTSPPADVAIRRGRTLDRRRRATLLVGVAGLAAVVTATTLTIVRDPGTTSVADDPQVTADTTTQEPEQPLTERMESAATAALAPYFFELGTPAWSFTDVVGMEVQPEDPTAQNFYLDYPAVDPGADTVLVRLQVGGFAPEEWELYDYEASCAFQLESRVAITCDTEQLADGSLRTTTVASRVFEGTSTSHMLTPEEASKLPTSAFVWLRGVSVTRPDGTIVAASEQVRARTAGDADWQIPLPALRSLAGDPSLAGADVAHEQAPSELP